MAPPHSLSGRPINANTGFDLTRQRARIATVANIGVSQCSEMCVSNTFWVDCDSREDVRAKFNKREYLFVRAHPVFHPNASFWQGSCARFYKGGPSSLLLTTGETGQTSRHRLKGDRPLWFFPSLPERSMSRRAASPTLLTRGQGEEAVVASKDCRVICE